MTSKREAITVSAQNRPSSVQLETQPRPNPANRPLSEQMPVNYKSPEAQAIDKWFEDLGYYEKTLEEMSMTKLDDSFKEELTAIENWFRVLSDPERTACLYSLLKGTTPLQIRFFITVLQQMAAKDASMDPLSASILTPHLGRPPRLSNDFSTRHSAELQRLSGEFSNRHSNDFSVRTKSLLRSSSTSQEDPLKSPPGLEVKHEWSSQLSQRSSSLNNTPVSPALPQPAEAGSFEQLKLNQQEIRKGINSVLNNDPRKKMIPRPRASEDEEEEQKEKKPMEPIDINLIQDIPTWFRSLRLHKYTTIFEKEDWRNLIKMTEEDLLDRGVAALGARRKMLKVFEAARQELTARNIAF